MKKQVKKGYPAGSGKRWLALFMCICLIGTMLPVTVRAESESEDAGQLYWFADKVNNDYENCKRLYVVWRQTINTDTAPVLDSTHSIVYASKPCESSFANVEFTSEKQHKFIMDKDGTFHICSVCDKKEQHADVATFTVDDENHSITATCPSCGDLGTITLSASDATYDGSDKAASTSGEIKGFTTPSIVYAKKGTDGSFATINSTPKNAGTYRAGNSSAVCSQGFKTCRTVPAVAEMPEISGTYGQTVEEMTLIPGKAKAGNTEINGTWAVTDSTADTARPAVKTADTCQQSPEEGNHSDRQRDKNGLQGDEIRH